MTRRAARPLRQAALMNAAELRILRIAASQRQVFTRTQAVDAGLTPSGVYRRTTNGLFVPVRPHICRSHPRLARTPSGWALRPRTRRARLGARRRRVHELDSFEEGHLAYLVPRSMRKRTTAGVVTSTASIGPPRSMGCRRTGGHIGYANCGRVGRQRDTYRARECAR